MKNDPIIILARKKEDVNSKRTQMILALKYHSSAKVNSPEISEGFKKIQVTYPNIPIEKILCPFFPKCFQNIGIRKIL